MKRHFLNFLAMISFVLVSCDMVNNSGEVEYFPFRSSKDGKWGLVKVDGSMALFEEEFKQCPTIVRDGRFFVQNADGMYEMYTADATPQKIGEYVHAGIFYDGVAPVAKKGKCISLIDKNGEDVKVLDKIDGKTVLRVSPFSTYNGLAAVETSNGQGCINTKGEVVIPTEYSWVNMTGSYVLAENKKYEGKSVDEKKVTVIKKDGEVLYEFKEDKYVNFCVSENSLYMGVAVGENGNIKWGVLDEKGEYLIRPSEKMKEISQIYNDYIVFSDGESYGVKNIKGEVLIRPKYEKLIFLGYGCLVAKKNIDDDFVLIDIEGNQVGDESFKDFVFVRKTTFPIQTGEHSWEFLGTDGVIVKGTPEIYELSANYGDDVIESDYFDFEAFASQLEISSKGILDITFAKSANMINSDKDLEFPDYNSLSYTATIMDVNVNVGAQFPEAVRSYYDGTLTDTTPIAITLNFKEMGRLNGKMSDVVSAIKDKINGLGKSVKVTSLGTVVKTKDGKYILCMLDRGQIFVLVSPNVSADEMIGVLDSASQDPAEDYSDENVEDENSYEVVDTLDY